MFHSHTVPHCVRTMELVNIKCTVTETVLHNTFRLDGILHFASIDECSHFAFKWPIVFHFWIVNTIWFYFVNSKATNKKKTPDPKWLVAWKATIRNLPILVFWNRRHSILWFGIFLHLPISNITTFCTDQPNLIFDFTFSGSR